MVRRQNRVYHNGLCTHYNVGCSFHHTSSLFELDMDAYDEMRMQVVEELQDDLMAWLDTFGTIPPVGTTFYNSGVNSHFIVDSYYYSAALTQKEHYKSTHRKQAITVQFKQKGE